MGDKGKHEHQIDAVGRTFDGLIDMYRSLHDATYLSSALSLLMPEVMKEVRIWMHNCSVRGEPVYKTAEQLGDAAKCCIYEYITKHPKQKKFTYDELMHEARSVIHRTSKPSQSG